MTKEKKTLSVVCPVYNETLAVPLFYERLGAVLRQLPKYDYELIFTNNCSTDDTLGKIRTIQEHDPSVFVLTMSRNFGYQPSVLAGITHARGDAIVVIDVDCEDPPELILTFVEKWEAGHDICYGIRGKRDEPIWLTQFRKLFYRVLKLTADTDIILDMAEFSLFSRRVRDVMIKKQNTFPFLRADIAYSGFNKIGIPYDRQKRIIGQSHYNLKGMFIFGAAGVMAVSTFPLRVPAYFLPIFFAWNLLGLVLDSVGVLPVFKALIILDICYLASLLCFQGLYIARIYKNGIARAVYIIDWSHSDKILNKRPEAV